MLRKKDEIIACFQNYFRKSDKKTQTGKIKHDIPMLVPLSLLGYFYLDT